MYGPYLDPDSNEETIKETIKFMRQLEICMLTGYLMILRNYCFSKFKRLLIF